MGSIFRRNNQEEPEKPEADQLSFEQFAYTAAYSLLPHYLYLDKAGGTRNLLIKSPRVAGIKILIGAVLVLAESEPDEQLARRFSETKGHSGQLAEGTQYRIVEYPRPAPLDVGDLAEIESLPPDQLMERLASVVLAPYFSVLLLSDDLVPFEYLILGQSLDGGATFRLVDQEKNANLGPGCEPELEILLDFLSQRENRND